MFFSRYEPSLNKYLLYNKTDLYYFSYEEIKEFLGKGKVIINKEYPENCMSAPLQFQLAITEACNFNCINCYDSEAHHKAKFSKELNIEQKKQLINYLHEWGVLLFQWSGGEPLLSKDLKEVVEYANKKMFVQSLLTNGSRLINDGMAGWVAKNFARVQVSLSAVKDFKKWSGVDKFQILIKGLKEIQKHCVKHKSSLNITTTVNEISVAELDKIAFLVNEINPAHWRIGEEVPLGKAERNSYHTKILEDSYKIFVKLKKQYRKKNWHHCFEIEEADTAFPIEWQSSPAGRTMLYMSANGEIYPFPYLKMPEFRLGKFPEDDIRDIWFNSPVLKKLRSVKYGDTDCKKCNNICVRWAREISYHFNKKLTETPLPFTNCPRKEVGI